MRLTVNSSERISDKLTGHTSMLYNRTGKHFTLIKWSTTSSLAKRPNLKGHTNFGFSTPFVFES